MFLAVAQSGSFRSAASQLFVSQPTLSRAVARLEVQLGTLVFERGPRGIALTESGEVLVEGARSVLDAAATLKRDVAQPRSASITLGTTATSARTIVAPFLSQWIPQHPDVRITAIEDSDTQLQSRLENRDCDVALISTDDSPRVDSLRLGTVPVNAMMPPTHPLARESGPISVVELGSQPLLLNGPGFPSTIQVLAAMEKAGATATVSYQCTAGQTLAAMAEAGLGVAIFGATTILRGFELHSRPVVDGGGRPLSFDLFVAWRRGVASSLAKDFAVGLATFTRARAGGVLGAVVS